MHYSIEVTTIVVNDLTWKHVYILQNMPLSLKCFLCLLQFSVSILVCS